MTAPLTLQQAHARWVQAKQAVERADAARRGVCADSPNFKELLEAYYAALHNCYVAEAALLAAVPPPEPPQEKHHEMSEVQNGMQDRRGPIRGDGSVVSEVSEDREEVAHQLRSVPQEPQGREQPMRDSAGYPVKQPEEYRTSPAPATRSAEVIYREGYEFGMTQGIRMAESSCRYGWEAGWQKSAARAALAAAPAQGTEVMLSVGEPELNLYVRGSAEATKIVQDALWAAQGQTERLR